METNSWRSVFLIIGLSVLVCQVLRVSARDPCRFPAIFNFGDSNSDTGGRAAAFGSHLGPPYGTSYFHGPAGRWSDGRLMIDFIAESLGFPFLSPFLDALGSNFTHGANFASAGATIRPQNLTLKQSGFSPMSLDVQVAEFTDFQRRSQIIREKGGVFGELMPKPEDFSRALYTFDIAQNDIDAGYFVNKTSDEIKTFVPDLVNQFKTAIKNIYDLGGRSFWIHNTGPFGCLPYSLTLLPITASQIDEVGCASPFNEVAQYFNHELKEAVVQLREELPEAALTYVDIYFLKFDLISRAMENGFVQPLVVCCGYGGKFHLDLKYGCGKKVWLHGEETIIGACEDPSVRISWDGVHYTQAANQWFAERLLRGWYSDPPIPLEMACHREFGDI